jgi:hypothetical protein
VTVTPQDIVFAEALLFESKCQLEGMKAANEKRRQDNLADAYGEDAFNALGDRTLSCVRHYLGF